MAVSEKPLQPLPASPLPASRSKTSRIVTLPAEIEGRRLARPRWQEDGLKTPLLRATAKRRPTTFLRLSMFPYPSGKPAHGPCVRNYVITECDFARVQRLRGGRAGVCKPIGLGTPFRAARRRTPRRAEGIDPADWPDRQHRPDAGPSLQRPRSLDRLGPGGGPPGHAGLLPLGPSGCSIQFTRRGLAYRKEATVTGIRFDQGRAAPMNRWIARARSWRSGAKVEKKRASCANWSCAFQPTTPRACSMTSTSSMAGRAVAHDAGPTGSGRSVGAQLQLPDSGAG